MVRSSSGAAQRTGFPARKSGSVQELCLHGICFFMPGRSFAYRSKSRDTAAMTCWKLFLLRTLLAKAVVKGLLSLPDSASSATSPGSVANTTMTRAPVMLIFASPVDCRHQSG